MKDPAVLLYTQDFLTGTFLMTNEQVGKYIRLLCLQQQNGGLCECDMLQICGEKDDKIWAKFEKNADGFYHNKRMFLEVNKRKNFNESQRKKAQKRWEKDEVENMPGDMPRECLLEDCNMKYENEIDKEWSKWKNYKKSEFRFSYKSEVSENAAKKELIELSGNNEETAIKIIEQSIANGWKGFFKLKTNGNSKVVGATDAELAGVISKHFASDKQ